MFSIFFYPENQLVVINKRDKNMFITKNFRFWSNFLREKHDTFQFVFFKNYLHA